MWLPTAGAAQTTAPATVVKSKEQINLKLCQANTHTHTQTTAHVLRSPDNLAIFWPYSDLS